MSKMSCEAAESVEARFMTIECSRSAFYCIANGASEL